MSYTSEMWKSYCDVVIKMYTQGYTVEEISKSLDSHIEIVKKCVEEYWGGHAPDSGNER